MSAGRDGGPAVVDKARHGQRVGPSRHVGFLNPVGMRTGKGAVTQADLSLESLLWNPVLYLC